jgi:hypothetical protein
MLAKLLGPLQRVSSVLNFEGHDILLGASYCHEFVLLVKSYSIDLTLISGGHDKLDASKIINYQFIIVG